MSSVETDMCLFALSVGRHNIFTFFSSCCSSLDIVRCSVQHTDRGVVISLFWMLDNALEITLLLLLDLISNGADENKILFDEIRPLLDVNSFTEVVNALIALITTSCFALQS